MNFLKRIRLTLAKTNFLVVLIIVVLVLLLLTLLVNSLLRNDSTQDTQTPPQEQQTVQQPTTPVTQFPDAQNLLEALPHAGNEFYADYLPLEPGAKPKILVDVSGNNGRTEFLQWAAQFEFDPFEVDIQIIENTPQHGQYSGNI